METTTLVHLIRQRVVIPVRPPPHGLKTNCAPAQFVNAILEILIIDEPAMTNE